MCSATSSGDSTLSRNVGLICAPSEWPWIARRYRKVSGEWGSTQHLNLFLIPPPLCKKLKHVRIEQCEEDVILDSVLFSIYWVIMSQQSDQCSWFHVYPLSFNLWNRHRSWGSNWTSCHRNFLQDVSLLSLLLTKIIPNQFVDFLVQHYLVVFWTVQLLSNIREDYLNVSSIGDLEIVVVQLHLCKLILCFTLQFPGTWTLIRLSVLGKGLSSLCSHLRTWRGVFDPVPHRSPSACEIRIPNQSAILPAVWCTPNPTWVIDSRSNLLISNSLASIPPLRALLLAFFPEHSTTWCSASSLKENGCRKASEISWCWTNEEDDSNHRVWNCPLVNMSASWFLVSTKLIRILRVQTNPIKQPIQRTLCVLDTCLIVGLLLFMIILIIASLSSKNVEHRTKLRRLNVSGNTIELAQFKIVVLNWSLNLVLGVFSWWCVLQQVSLHIIFGFLSLVGRRMEHFKNQIPKIKSVKSIHAWTRIKRDNLRFRRTVSNRCLFLAHPTYGNKCSTSENT